MGSGVGAPSQRGSGAGSSQVRVFQPHVCNPEKRWGGGARPIINLKRLNSHLRIQHFKTENIFFLRSPKKRRLYGQARLEGCVFDHPNSCESLQITKVYVPRESVPILLPSLWVSDCSSGIHEGYEASLVSSQSSGDSSDLLSGQHANYELNTVRSKNSSREIYNSLGEVGIPYQLEEEHNRSSPVNRVSGPSCGFKVFEPQGSGSEGSENSERMSSASEQGYSVREELSSYYRIANFSESSCLAWPPSLQSPSEIKESGSQTEWLPGYPHYFGQRNQERSLVLDIRSSHPEREVNHVANCSGGNMNRCLQDRLGSNLRGRVFGGALDERRKQSAHQLLGVKSSLPRSERFCLQFGTPAYQASGQLNSYSLYQQEGRYSLQNAFRFISLTLVLVFEEEVINICRAHPGGIEWFSRFIIQKAPGFQQLDVESSGFRDSFEEVGSTRCRSVCSPPQYSAEIIFQLSSRPRGSGLRCTGSELGGSELLCLSSLCSPGVCPAENKTGEGQEGHSDCSKLDSSGLVSSLAAVVGRQSSHFTSECGSPQESPRRASPSDTPGLSQSDRLESPRSRGEFKDISTDAFNLICSAWRRGTEKSYSVTWRKWCSWCQDKNINPLSASISDVIEFITSGFQLGLQYSTLNSPRSALSATLPSCEGVPVGQHPLIATLLQGIFNERPPLPKYSFTWDVNVIITFIQKNRSLSADLPLMQLSQKLVMLFALATAARSSDFHLLDLRFRSYSQEGVSFQLAGLSKTRRSGPPKSLFIKRLHSDPTLPCYYFRGL